MEETISQLNELVSLLDEVQQRSTQASKALSGVATGFSKGTYTAANTPSLSADTQQSLSLAVATLSQLKTMQRSPLSGAAAESLNNEFQAYLQVVAGMLQPIATELKAAASATAAAADSTKSSAAVTGTVVRVSEETTGRMKSAEKPAETSVTASAARSRRNRFAVQPVSVDAEAEKPVPVILSLSGNQKFSIDNGTFKSVFGFSPTASRSSRNFTEFASLFRDYLSSVPQAKQSTLQQALAAGDFVDFKKAVEEIHKKSGNTGDVKEIISNVLKEAASTMLSAVGYATDDAVLSAVHAVAGDDAVANVGLTKSIGSRLRRVVRQAVTNTKRVEAAGRTLPTAELGLVSGILREAIFQQLNPSAAQLAWEQGGEEGQTAMVNAKGATSSQINSALTQRFSSTYRAIESLTQNLNPRRRFREEAQGVDVGIGSQIVGFQSSALFPNMFLDQAEVAVKTLHQTAQEQVSAGDLVSVEVGGRSVKLPRILAERFAPAIQAAKKASTYSGVLGGGITGQSFSSMFGGAAGSQQVQNLYAAELISGYVQSNELTADPQEFVSQLFGESAVDTEITPAALFAKRLLEDLQRQETQLERDAVQAATSESRAILNRRAREVKTQIAYLTKILSPETSPQERGYLVTGVASGTGLSVNQALSSLYGSQAQTAFPAAAPEIVQYAGELVESLQQQGLAGRERPYERQSSAVYLENAVAGYNPEEPRTIDAIAKVKNLGTDAMEKAKERTAGGQSYAALEFFSDYFGLGVQRGSAGGTLAAAQIAGAYLDEAGQFDVARAREAYAENPQMTQNNLQSIFYAMTEASRRDLPLLGIIRAVADVPAVSRAELIEQIRQVAPGIGQIFENPKVLAKVVEASQNDSSLERTRGILKAIAPLLQSAYVNYVQQLVGGESPEQTRALLESERVDPELLSLAKTYKMLSAAELDNPNNTFVQGLEYITSGAGSAAMAESPLDFIAEILGIQDQLAEVRRAQEIAPPTAEELAQQRFSVGQSASAQLRRSVGVTPDRRTAQKQKRLLEIGNMRDRLAIAQAGGVSEIAITYLKKQITEAERAMEAEERPTAPIDRLKMQLSRDDLKESERTELAKELALREYALSTYGFSDAGRDEGFGTGDIFQRLGRKIEHARAMRALPEELQALFAQRRYASDSEIPDIDEQIKAASGSVPTRDWNAYLDFYNLENERRIRESDYAGQAAVFYGRNSEGFEAQGALSFDPQAEMRDSYGVDDFTQQVIAGTPLARMVRSVEVSGETYRRSPIDLDQIVIGDPNFDPYDEVLKLEKYVPESFENSREYINFDETDRTDMSESEVEEMRTQAEQAYKERMRVEKEQREREAAYWEKYFDLRINPKNSLLELSRDARFYSQHEDYAAKHKETLGLITSSPAYRELKRELGYDDEQMFELFDTLLAKSDMADKDAVGPSELDRELMEQALTAYRERAAQGEYALPENFDEASNKAALQRLAGKKARGESLTMQEQVDYGKYRKYERNALVRRFHNVASSQPSAEPLLQFLQILYGSLPQDYAMDDDPEAVAKDVRIRTLLSKIDGASTQAQRALALVMSPTSSRGALDNAIAALSPSERAIITEAIAVLHEETNPGLALATSDIGKGMQEARITDAVETASAQAAADDRQSSLPTTVATIGQKQEANDNLTKQKQDELDAVIKKQRDKEDAEIKERRDSEDAARKERRDEREAALREYRDEDDAAGKEKSKMKALALEIQADGKYIENVHTRPSFFTHRLKSFFKGEEIPPEAESALAELDQLEKQYSAEVEGERSSPFSDRGSFQKERLRIVSQAQGIIKRVGDALVSRLAAEEQQDEPDAEIKERREKNDELTKKKQDELDKAIKKQRDEEDAALKERRDREDAEIKKRRDEPDATLQQQRDDQQKRDEDYAKYGPFRGIDSQLLTQRERAADLNNRAEERRLLDLRTSMLERQKQLRLQQKRAQSAKPKTQQARTKLEKRKEEIAAELSQLDSEMESVETQLKKVRKFRFRQDPVLGSMQSTRHVYQSGVSTEELKARDRELRQALKNAEIAPEFAGVLREKPSSPETATPVTAAGRYWKYLKERTYREQQRSTLAEEADKLRKRLKRKDLSTAKRGEAEKKLEHLVAAIDELDQQIKTEGVDVNKNIVSPMWDERLRGYQTGNWLPEGVKEEDLTAYDRYGLLYSQQKAVSEELAVRRIPRRRVVRHAKAKALRRQSYQDYVRIQQEDRERHKALQEERPARQQEWQEEDQKRQQKRQEEDQKRQQKRQEEDQKRQQKQQEEDQKRQKERQEEDAALAQPYSSMGPQVVGFDLETTIPRPGESARILQFAAVGGGKNPAGKFKTETMNVEQGARGAELTAEQRRNAQQLLLDAAKEGRTIIGHNIKEFDLPILFGGAENVPSIISNNAIDTLQMARELQLPGSYTLGSLARLFGLEYDPSRLHEAEYDTQLNVLLYDKLEEAKRARDRDADKFSKDMLRQFFDRSALTDEQKSLVQPLVTARGGYDQARVKQTSANMAYMLAHARRLDSLKSAKVDGRGRLLLSDAEGRPITDQDYVKSVLSMFGYDADQTLTNEDLKKMQDEAAVVTSAFDPYRVDGSLDTVYNLFNSVAGVVSGTGPAAAGRGRYTSTAFGYLRKLLGSSLTGLNPAEIKDTTKRWGTYVPKFSTERVSDPAAAAVGEIGSLLADATAPTTTARVRTEKRTDATTAVVDEPPLVVTTVVEPSAKEETSETVASVTAGKRRTPRRSVRKSGVGKTTRGTGGGEGEGSSGGGGSGGGGGVRAAVTGGGFSGPVTINNLQANTVDVGTVSNATINARTVLIQLQSGASLGSIEVKQILDKDYVGPKGRSPLTVEQYQAGSVNRQTVQGAIGATFIGTGGGYGGGGGYSAKSDALQARENQLGISRNNFQSRIGQFAGIDDVEAQERIKKETQDFVKESLRLLQSDILQTDTYTAGTAADAPRLALKQAIDEMIDPANEAAVTANFGSRLEAISALATAYVDSLDALPLSEETRKITKSEVGELNRTLQSVREQSYYTTTAVSTRQNALEAAARDKTKQEEYAARDKARQEEYAARDKARQEEYAARDKARSVGGRSGGGYYSKDAVLQARENELNIARGRFQERTGQYAGLDNAAAQQLLKQQTTDAAKASLWAAYEAMLELGDVTDDSMVNEPWLFAAMQLEDIIDPANAPEVDANFGERLAKASEFVTQYMTSLDTAPLTEEQRAVAKAKVDEVNSIFKSVQEQDRYTLGAISSDQRDTDNAARNKAREDEAAAREAARVDEAEKRKRDMSAKESRTAAVLTAKGVLGSARTAFDLAGGEVNGQSYAVGRAELIKTTVDSLKETTELDNLSTAVAGLSAAEPASVHEFTDALKQLNDAADSANLTEAAAAFAKLTKIAADLQEAIPTSAALTDDQKEEAMSALSLFTARAAQTDYIKPTAGVIEATERKRMSVLEEQLQAAASRPGFFGLQRDATQRRLLKEYAQERFGQAGADIMYNNRSMRFQARTEQGGRIDLIEASSEDLKRLQEDLSNAGAPIGLEELQKLQNVMSRTQQTRNQTPFADPLFFAASRIRDIQTLGMTAMSALNLPSTIAGVIDQAASPALNAVRSMTSLRGLSRDQGVFNKAVAAASEQQALFGGSLTSNIGSITSFIPLTNAYGVDISQVVNVARKLAAFDPAQGMEGASIAIKEFLSGNVASLSRRFEINRSALSKIDIGNATEMLNSLDEVLAQMGVTDQLINEAANSRAAQYDKMLGRLETMGIKVSEFAVGAATPLLESVLGSNSFLGKMADTTTVNLMRDEGLKFTGSAVLSKLADVDMYAPSLSTFTRQVDTVFQEANDEIAAAAASYQKTTGVIPLVSPYRLLENMKPEERVQFRNMAQANRLFKGMTTEQALMQASRDMAGDYASYQEFVNQRKLLPTDRMTYEQMTKSDKFKELKADAEKAMIDEVARGAGEKFRPGILTALASPSTFLAGSLLASGVETATRSGALLKRATIGEVTDLDTFRTAGGERIRLVGVDAPETGSKAAVKAMAQAVEVGLRENENITYEAGGLDQYGRTLAVVYNEQGQMINSELIARGIAGAMTDSKAVNAFGSFVADQGIGVINEAAAKAGLGGLPVISDEVRKAYYMQTYFGGIGGTAGSVGTAVGGGMLTNATIGALAGSKMFAGSAAASAAAGAGIAGTAGLVALGAGVAAGGYALITRAIDLNDVSVEKMRELYKMQAEFEKKQRMQNKFDAVYLSNAGFSGERETLVSKELVKTYGNHIADTKLSEALAASGLTQAAYEKAATEIEKLYNQQDQPGKDVLGTMVLSPDGTEMVSLTEALTQSLAFAQDANLRDTAVGKESQRLIGVGNELIDNADIIQLAQKYGLGITPSEIGLNNNQLEALGLLESPSVLGRDYRDAAQAAQGRSTQLTATQMARFLTSEQIKTYSDAMRQRLLNDPTYQVQAKEYMDQQFDQELQRKQQRFNTFAEQTALNNAMGLFGSSGPLSAPQVMTSQFMLTSFADEGARSTLNAAVEESIKTFNSVADHNRAMAELMGPYVSTFQTTFANYVAGFSRAGSGAEALRNYMSNGDPMFALNEMRRISGLDWRSMINQQMYLPMQLNSQSLSQFGYYEGRRALQPSAPMFSTSLDPLNGYQMPYTSGPRGRLAYANMIASTPSVRQLMSPADLLNVYNTGIQAQTELAQRNLQHNLQMRDLARNHNRSLEDITRNAFRQLESIHLNATRQMTQAVQQRELSKRQSLAQNYSSIGSADLTEKDRREIDVVAQAGKKFADQAEQSNPAAFLRFQGRLESENTRLLEQAFNAYNAIPMENVGARESAWTSVIKYRDLVTKELEAQLVGASPEDASRIRSQMALLGRDPERGVQAQQFVDQQIGTMTQQAESLKALQRQKEDLLRQQSYAGLERQSLMQNMTAAQQSGDPLQIQQAARALADFDLQQKRLAEELQLVSRRIENLANTAPMWSDYWEVSYSQIEETTSTTMSGLINQYEDFNISLKQQIEDALLNLARQKEDIVRSFTDAAIEIATQVPATMAKGLTALIAYTNDMRAVEAYTSRGDFDTANALAYAANSRLALSLYGDSNSPEAKALKSQLSFDARPVPGSLDIYSIDTPQGKALKVYMVSSATKTTRPSSGPPAQIEQDYGVGIIGG